MNDTNFKPISIGKFTKTRTIDKMYFILAKLSKKYGIITVIMFLIIIEILINI